MRTRHGLNRDPRRDLWKLQPLVRVGERGVARPIPAGGRTRPRPPSLSGGCWGHRRPRHSGACRSIAPSRPHLHGASPGLTRSTCSSLSCWMKPHLTLKNVSFGDPISREGPLVGPWGLGPERINGGERSSLVTARTHVCAHPGHSHGPPAPDGAGSLTPSPRAFHRVPGGCGRPQGVPARSRLPRLLPSCPQSSHGADGSRQRSPRSRHGRTRPPSLQK